MISAMYENGGNTTQRFLDGHPEMFVYPFESQLGTRLVIDSLASVFPVKYRWPVFALEASAYQDYKAIIDEEGKVRARTPQVSKFRHLPFDFSDDQRCELYQQYIKSSGRSRANNVAAFFRATFDAWKDYKKTKTQKVYVGYSSIVVVDADKILSDFNQAQVLHVVRNPWSAYADTKKRPMPLSLENYMLGWTLNQYHALLYKNKYPDRLHIVRLEDELADPQKVLGEICKKIGIKESASLAAPSWNANPLEEIYPWGTIRKATREDNYATDKELSLDEREEIRSRTWQYLKIFNYQKFI